MTDVSREEFAKAIAATLESVEHLYKEIDLLFTGLRTDLSDLTNPLGLVSASRIGKTKRRDGRVIFHDYPLLFGPVNPDEEDEEEDLDDQDQSVSVSSGKSKQFEIVSGQPLMAIRLTMYSPDKSNLFEPMFQYAALSDWSVGNGPPPTACKFVLKSYMIRRIPKALDFSAQKGMRLQTQARVNKVIGGKGVLGSKKAAEKNLSCQLPLGVNRVPLFGVNDPEELENLVQGIGKMWNEALHL